MIFLSVIYAKCKKRIKIFLSKYLKVHLGSMIHWKILYSFIFKKEKNRRSTKQRKCYKTIRKGNYRIAI
jgi:hypothetical protein